MTFFIFAPLAFIVIRLSVNWRWRTVVIAALGVGLVADIMLDFLVARRI